MVHGTTKATKVHARVQSRGGEARAGAQAEGVEKVSRELELTETADGNQSKRAEIDEKKDPNRPLASDERRGGDAACDASCGQRRWSGTSSEKLQPSSPERKMSFELIAAEEARYPKALMCRALGLSRSGHHSFRTPRAVETRARRRNSSTCSSRRSSASSEASTRRTRIEKELRRRRHRTSTEAGDVLDAAPGARCSSEAALADDDGLASQRAHRAQPPAAPISRPRCRIVSRSPTRRTCT